MLRFSSQVADRFAWLLYNSSSKVGFLLVFFSSKLANCSASLRSRRLKIHEISFSWSAVCCLNSRVNAADLIMWEIPLTDTCRLLRQWCRSSCHQSPCITSQYLDHEVSFYLSPFGRYLNGKLCALHQCGTGKVEHCTIQKLTHYYKNDP